MPTVHNITVVVLIYALAYISWEHLSAVPCLWCRAFHRILTTTLEHTVSTVWNEVIVPVMCCKAHIDTNMDLD